MTIDFTSDGAGTIKADVNGSIPVLELMYGKENLAIKGSRIQGTLEVDEKGTRAHFNGIGVRLSQTEIGPETLPMMRSCRRFSYL